MNFYKLLFLSLIAVPITAFGMVGAAAGRVARVAPRAWLTPAAPHTSYYKATPVLAVASTSPQIIRNLHISEIKGLHTPFNHSATYHLSPVVAAAYAETNWLEKLYEFQDQENPSTKLVRALFFKRDTTFKPTENKSLPAYFLTPQIVAQIIAHLEKGTLTTPEAREKIAQELVAVAHPSKLSKKKIFDLLDLIQASADVTDTQNVYESHVTHIILLAFIYHKYESRADIEKYLQTILEQLALQPEASLLEKCIDKLQALWKKNESQLKFTDAEYEKYDASLSDSLTFALVKRFIPAEQLVFYFTARDTIKSTCAPQVRQGNYGYQGKKLVPDCMETSMRSIVNELLTNGKDSSFDLSMVPAQIKPTQALTQFYTTYKSFGTVNMRSAGQAWMNLVSGHTFLEYIQANYELDPRVSNFIALFNYFFTIDAQNLEELSQALSSEHRTVTFTQVKFENDDKARIQITLTNSAGTTRKFHLVIEPGHAYIENENVAHMNNDSYMHMMAMEKLVRKNPKKYRHLVPLIARLFSCASADLIMSMVRYFTTKNPLLFQTLLPFLPLTDWHFCQTMSDILCNLLEFKTAPRENVLNSISQAASFPEFQYALGHTIAKREKKNRLLPEFNELLQKYEKASKGYVEAMKSTV